MTDNTGRAPGIPGGKRPSVRSMVSGGLRALGSTALLVAIYYLLPLDHSSTWIAATAMIIGLVVFIALVGFQALWIIRSTFPGMRAVEALATSLPADGDRPDHPRDRGQDHFWRRYAGPSAPVTERGCRATWPVAPRRPAAALP